MPRRKTPKSGVSWPNRPHAGFCAKRPRRSRCRFRRQAAAPRLLDIPLPAREADGTTAQRSCIRKRPFLHATMPAPDSARSAFRRGSSDCRFHDRRTASGALPRRCRAFCFLAGPRRLLARAFACRQRPRARPPGRPLCRRSDRARRGGEALKAVVRAAGVARSRSAPSDHAAPLRRAIGLRRGCRINQTGCTNLTTADFADLVRGAQAGRAVLRDGNGSPQNRHLVADIQKVETRDGLCDSLHGTQSRSLCRARDRVAREGIARHRRPPRSLRLIRRLAVGRPQRRQLSRARSGSVFGPDFGDQTPILGRPPR
jgi:hypothetical protein